MIHLEDGRTYAFVYDDHLGHPREAVAKVLRHYDARPSPFILPARSRPIESVEVEVVPEKIGSLGKPIVLNIALVDIQLAVEVVP